MTLPVFRFHSPPSSPAPKRTLRYSRESRSCYWQKSIKRFSSNNMQLFLHPLWYPNSFIQRTAPMLLMHRRYFLLFLTICFECLQTTKINQVIKKRQRAVQGPRLFQDDAMIIGVFD